MWQTPYRGGGGGGGMDGWIRSQKNVCFPEISLQFWAADFFPSEKLLDVGRWVD